MTDRLPPRWLSEARARSLLLGLQGELGRGGLNFILRQAGLARLVNSPDAEAPPRLSAADYAAILQAAENHFGVTAPLVLRRVGRGAFRQLVRQRPMVASWHSVLALTSRVNAQATVLRWLADELADPNGKVTVEVQGQHITLTDYAGDEAFGRQRATPLCFCTLGMIEEAARWARGSLDGVAETACRAQGAPACQFVVYALNTAPLPASAP